MYAIRRTLLTLFVVVGLVVPLVPASASTTSNRLCRVVAESLNIRQAPNGAVVGTLYYGDYFDVVDFRDNIWVRGDGYWFIGHSTYYVASGYVLRNYLNCN